MCEAFAPFQRCKTFTRSTETPHQNIQLDKNNKTRYGAKHNAFLFSLMNANQQARQSGGSNQARHAIAWWVLDKTRCVACKTVKESPY